MGFYEIAESGFLYFLVILVLLYVVGVSVLYLIKCYKHAIKKGIPKEKIHSVIKGTVLFSIVPSISVVTGLISLAALIGVAYSWLRLSVIGSVTYEIMAADMALKSIGTDIANADGRAFGVVMLVMAIGIIGGLFLDLFLIKPVHLGVTKSKSKDKKWSALGSTTFMSALLVALIIPMLAKGAVYILTYLTSMGITILLDIVIRKTNAKWLKGFILSIALIGAMCASVLFTGLLG